MIAMASEEMAIRAIIDHEIDTYDPYEGEVMVWTTLTGESQIVYDARGLVEPNAEVPKVSSIVRHDGSVRRERSDHAPDQSGVALADQRAGDH